MCDANHVPEGLALCPLTTKRLKKSAVASEPHPQPAQCSTSADGRTPQSQVPCKVPAPRRSKRALREPLRSLPKRAIPPREQQKFAARNPASDASARSRSSPVLLPAESRLPPRNRPGSL